jgi:MerR family redox-sensitive transcriptional activator SoxR
LATAHSIGDIARQAGLRSSAIRYYERVGLLEPVPRAHGRRQYDERVLQQLLVIGVAQDAGFTIAEIRTLLHGFAVGTPAVVRWRALAQDKLPQVEALIARAQEMKRIIEQSLQCGGMTLEDCALSLRSSIDSGA